MYLLIVSILIPNSSHPLTSEINLSLSFATDSYFNEANKTEEQSSTVLVPPINNLESLKMFIQNLEEELKGFNNIKQKRESSEESKSSKFFDILFYKRLTELALNIKTAKSRGIKLDKSTDTIYSQLIDSINKGVETKIQFLCP